MSEAHRSIREQLGAYALGQLDATERAEVRAHLDGCAECRAELAAIAPLAEPLRRVDPDRLEEPVPPPELEREIVRHVRAERGAARAGRRRGWLPRVALPATAVVAVVAVAGAIGYRLAPDEPELPLERVTVRERAPGIAARADVVAHTWGMEIKLVATGFARGRAYRVEVVDRRGRRLAAGRFLGTGAATMRCNLNTSVLRDDATAFRVLDRRERVVLSSRL